MFVRGFKSWCEGVSAQVRRDLGLTATGPLDPRKLAVSLGVDLWTPTDVPGLPTEVSRRLLKSHSDSWSAITISHGDVVVIVYNPAHSPARQASDLMHELAHVLLGHEPTRMFISPHSGIGLRTHDKDQEAEASWLAGCLLLPREALLHIRRRGLSTDEARRAYGVSTELLRFRLNATGVNVQIGRAKGIR